MHDKAHYTPNHVFDIHKLGLGWGCVYLHMADMAS